MNLLSAWVVLAPGGHELGEVMGSEDGGITGQVVEAKHQGQGSDKPSFRVPGKNSEGINLHLYMHIQYVPMCTYSICTS